MHKLTMENCEPVLDGKRVEAVLGFNLARLAMDGSTANLTLSLMVKIDSEPVGQASSDEMESMSTSKLVEELKKRDGVSVITADPHEEYSVSTSQCGFRDTGPAVILVIRD